MSIGRWARWGMMACGLGLLAAGDPAGAAELPPGLYAEFTTPRGAFTAELFFAQAPLTVTSFVGLAEGTLGPADATTGARKPFFDGLKFHRVVPGFVIQGGDPLGTGEGGPGYEFPDEFRAGLSHDAAGILSMANSGPDTNGSQFFFTLAPVRRLDWLHSVFGRVVTGADLLPQVQQGDTFAVRIVRHGPAAEAFRADEKTFAALVAAARRATPPWFDDPDGVLPTDPPRAKVFNHKLANVARFTGQRVYARVLQAWDVTRDGAASADQVARRWAERLDAARDGVTAIYWADRAAWGLWFGDVAAARFTPEGTTAATPLSERKTAFLAAARQRAAVVIAAAEQRSGEPVPAAQQIKLEVDEVLDGLIALLEVEPALALAP